MEEKKNPFNDGTLTKSFLIEYEPFSADKKFFVPIYRSLSTGVILHDVLFSIGFPVRIPSHLIPNHCYRVSQDGVFLGLLVPIKLYCKEYFVHSQCDGWLKDEKYNLIIVKTQWEGVEQLFLNSL